MFGYLDINKQSLEDGQRGLWQTFMCGLCFSTKQLYGNVPRTVISNDVNFFNVLFHSVAGVDVNIKQGRCFSHPIRKRSLLNTTDLTDRLSTANVLLTYWNIYDDTIDGGSAKKKAALSLFRRSYNKAKGDFAELDTMLAKRYDELRLLEQSNCSSIDQVADAFAKLSSDFATLVLGDAATPHLTTLCYNVGKWIYLIDALDDAEKDIKRHNYNPFVACYSLASATQLTQHFDELQFEMYAVLNRIAQSYNDLNLTKYTCILNNVVYDSIRAKTKDILSKYKAKNTTNTTTE